MLGFPSSSAGKESACKARGLGLIPGSGRSPEEGKGYPLQYSWASLVTQLVKNLSTKRETWVRSLGCKDPLEKGTAIHSSILENSMDCRILGVTKSRTRLSDFHFSDFGETKSYLFLHCCYSSLHAQLLQWCPTLCDHIHEL